MTIIFQMMLSFMENRECLGGVGWGGGSYLNKVEREELSSAVIFE